MKRCDQNRYQHNQRTFDKVRYDHGADGSSFNPLIYTVSEQFLSNQLEIIANLLNLLVPNGDFRVLSYLWTKVVIIIPLLCLLLNTSLNILCLCKPNIRKNLDRNHGGSRTN